MFIYELVVAGSDPITVTKFSDIAPVLSKEFIDNQATTESRFTLKCICDMIKTHNQNTCNMKNML